MAIDINFRLKHLDKSTDERDPGLHMGLAYFVEQEAYIKHVRKYANQKEVCHSVHSFRVGSSWLYVQISSCSSFKMLAHTEMKNNKGLRATGVVMVICARHEMILPMSAGDLQVGERCVPHVNVSQISGVTALTRYCNVDYMAALVATNFTEAKSLFWSYDIACQWKCCL